MDPSQNPQGMATPSDSGSPMSDNAHAAPARAPWEEDDDWGQPAAPVQQPPQQQQQQQQEPHVQSHEPSPASVPASQSGPQSPLEGVAAPAAPQAPAAAEEDEQDVFGEKSPVSVNNNNSSNNNQGGFIPASNSNENLSPSSQQPQNEYADPQQHFPEAADEPQIPVKPETPSVDDRAAMDAIYRKIADRTAAMDKATKEKEDKILKAAQEYLKQLQGKREKEVGAAKAAHQKDQQDGARKIDELKKSGQVWSSVGVLLDLSKPNQHSKNTEKMRTLLNTLSEKKEVKS